MAAVVSLELREAWYEPEQSCTTTGCCCCCYYYYYYLEQSCTTDEPQTVVKKRTKLHCASACSGQLECRELNFDETTEDCSLYKHKALFFAAISGCFRYKVRSVVIANA